MKKVLLISSVLVLIDQVIKYFALNYFKEPFVIIKNFFEFTYKENSGIAFSIPAPNLLIIILNIIIIGLVIALSKSELNLKKVSTQISVAMLIAGAFSNLIDRTVHGFVIDFISIWVYPIFNVADIFITIAVLWILVFYGKIKKIKK